MRTGVVRPGMRWTRLAALVVAVAPTVAAQGDPTTGSYTINASRAVASWPAVTGPPAEPRLVLDGAGGSVVLLNVTDSANPTQWTLPATAVLPTGGLVWSIEPRGDAAGKLSQVWCAAGPAGLVRFSRALNTFAKDFTFRTVGNATCLALFQVGTKVYAFVGTNDSRTRGRVHLVDPDPGSGAPPRILDTWEVGKNLTSTLGAPVYCLAATTTLLATTVTLLVGTACQGVFRFDIPTSTLSFGTMTPVKWVPASGANAFARDIAIDASGTGRSYVAAGRRGVYALNLASGALSEDTSTGWPVQPVPGSLTFALGVALKTGLTNPVAGTRLIVATGRAFVDEFQHHGECEKQVPCDCDGTPTDCQAGADAMGVDVFRGVDSGTGPPANEASYHPSVSADPAPAYGVSLPADASANPYFIDMAGFGAGFFELQNDRAGTTWTLTNVGRYDELDEVPLSSMDDVWLQDDAIYATTELQLLTFNKSVSNPLATLEDSDVPTGVRGCLLLTGFSNSVPPTGKGRLYCSDQLNGVLFVNASATSPPNPVLSANNLDTTGRAIGLRAVLGLEATPDRWLYVVNAAGEVKVWRVGDATEPTEAQVIRLGGYVHSGGITFFDAHVVASAGTHVVYVSYGPTTGGELGAGLIILRATYSAGSPPSVSFQFIGKHEAVKVPRSAAEPVAHVSYDTDGPRVYVALACLGMASFGISPTDPTDVTAIQYRPSPLVTRVDRGVGNRLYVGLLSQGLGVLRHRDHLKTTALDVYPLPFQVLSFRVDPANANRVYVAGGSAGIYEYTFNFSGP